MSTAVSSPVLQCIRRLVTDPRLRGSADQELLQAFLDHQDDAAFEEIVRRHGVMVLDVCRAVLPNATDVEDAFQATFLILARKANSVRRSASLASWLHGVAYRTACKARTDFARRKKHEARVAVDAGAEASDDLSWREVRQVVHEELNALADCYRAPLVLCCLEGATQEAAAVRLSLARRTLRERLERGRALLRMRLMRRGLGSAALLLAAAWPSAKASGAVPMSMMGSIVEAATTVAAGGAATSVISAKVAALAEGGMKAMFMSKITAATMLVSGILVVAVAGTLGFGAGPADQPAAQVAKGQEAPKAAPPEVRSAAPTGLGKIHLYGEDLKKLRYGEDLKKLLKAKDEEVQKAAIEALKKVDNIQQTQTVVVKNVLLTAIDTKRNTISVRIAGMTDKGVWPNRQKLYLGIDGKIVQFPVESALLERLPLAKNAKITINGKDAAAADLKVPSLITFSLVTDGERLEISEITATK